MVGLYRWVSREYRSEYGKHRASRVRGHYISYCYLIYKVPHSRSCWRRIRDVGIDVPVDFLDEIGVNIFAQKETGWHVKGSTTERVGGQHADTMRKFTEYMSELKSEKSTG